MLTPPKVHVPKNYYFGITAASSDNPDSFEIKSFVTHSLGTTTQDESMHHEAGWHDHTGTQYESAQHHEAQKTSPKKDEHEDWYWTDDREHIPDASADSFKTETERFHDLHDRLSVLNHQLDIMFHDLTTFKDQSEQRHRDLVHWLSPTHDYAEQAKNAIDRMEKIVTAIQQDVENKETREHLEQLYHLVVEGHETLPHAVHAGKFLI